MFVACCDEILRNVSDNLERKLPDSEEMDKGLIHKLTGSEKDITEDMVSIFESKVVTETGFDIVIVRGVSSLTDLSITQSLTIRQTCNLIGYARAV